MKHTITLCRPSRRLFSQAVGADATARGFAPVTEGSLLAMDKRASRIECPLKHTDVKADITGFLARYSHAGIPEYGSRQGRSGVRLSAAAYGCRRHDGHVRRRPACQG